MSLTIYQVDAFTDQPFAGNPAAVCVLPAPRSAAWMQHVASEMNLSETAFLVEREGAFDLRWFTPVDEVDLCGHATLASAHILWEAGYLAAGETAVFETKSGRLTAQQQEDYIVMDFPSEPVAPVESPAGLAEAFGVEPNYVGKNRMDYLVLLDSETTVRSLQPNMEQLSLVDTRGIIVTAPSSAEEVDFVSRFFAPRLGIPEDPVTGSAHCCLGPFWQQRLEKDELVGYQASPRGGTVYVRVEGDRVHLGGHAVTVLKGELVAGV